MLSIRSYLPDRSSAAKGLFQATMRCHRKRLKLCRALCKGKTVCRAYCVRGVNQIFSLSLLFCFERACPSIIRKVIIAVENEGLQLTRDGRIFAVPVQGQCLIQCLASGPTLSALVEALSWQTTFGSRATFC